MSDFTLTPDDVFEEEPSFNTLVTEFENNVEQRRALVGSPLRRWKLKFMARTQAEFQTIRDFFITKKGQLTSFTWTNPNDNTEYTVRFEQDKISFSRIRYQMFDFDITFRQVL